MARSTIGRGRSPLDPFLLLRSGIADFTESKKLRDGHFPDSPASAYHRVCWVGVEIKLGLSFIAYIALLVGQFVFHF